MGRVTQKQVVLDHLTNIGTLTKREAFIEYGISHLGDRVFNLRNEGYPITTTMVSVKTRYGKEEIAVYELQKQQ